MKHSTPVKPRPPEERKRAEVAAFQRFFRIHSWAVYAASKLDPDGIDGDHPPDLDDGTLGARAREALNASRFIAPDHPEWERVARFSKELPDSALLERFMARAGVKSERTLYEGVGDVSLVLMNGEIALMPLHYKGRGSFAPIRGVEPTELPETVSDEELGATIRRLVDVSRRPWRY